jgi:integrase
VTSHVFRKTAATELDRAGLSAREIADQLGHAKVSMTQDRYLGRRAGGSAATDALDRAHRKAEGKHQNRRSGT